MFHTLGLFTYIFELVDRKRAYVSKEKYELLKINFLALYNCLIYITESAKN